MVTNMRLGLVVVMLCSCHSGCAQARPHAGAPEADPRVPCQLCYVDKERLLLVGYTDGTVITFQEEARLRTHR